MEKITILIADDHRLIRETWCFILNADPRFQIVGQAGTGEEAIEQAKKMLPDVVIMDINLPGLNGIEATPLIRKFSPGSKILGISSHTQPAYARQMIREGAMGYVTKNSSKQEMFKAIIEIQNGRKYICEEIKNIFSDQVMSGNDSPAGLNSLSEREIEIIHYIKKGFSSKEISSSLNIALRTVEVHRYNILKKLDIKNCTALVSFTSQYLDGGISNRSRGKQ